MVNLAIEAAKLAGKFLLDNFGKVIQIHSKGDRNLATEIDRGAEKIIVDMIKRRFPTHGILAEEKERKDIDNDYLWIIDPLDGTHNYIRNINIFGVSIGLVHKGQFILGVIYMPSEDELYVGEEGNGAYKNEKKISVSDKDKLKECSISFDSSIRYSPQVMIPALEKLVKEVFNIRMLGSSARILSYVAEGKLDAAVEYHDRPWDFAAGVCLIKEAGGIFTDLGGRSPTYKTVGYIAANKVIHGQILGYVKI
jgi:myo-inositol-1(or 4)-monophosphatase